MSSTLTGKCACGKITYELLDASKEALKEGCGACHCQTCQAWSGGVFMGVKSKEVELTGKENLSIWKSSAWAERAFCKCCGSSMYYRVTEHGPMEGDYHFGAGTLDDWGELSLTGEIFIDRRPSAYAFKDEEKRQVFTKEEFEKMISGGDGPECGSEKIQVTEKGVKAS